MHFMSSLNAEYFHTPMMDVRPANGRTKAPISTVWRTEDLRSKNYSRLLIRSYLTFQQRGNSQNKTQTNKSDEVRRNRVPHVTLLLSL
jgi:hypothetical protein